MMLPNDRKTGAYLGIAGASAFVLLWIIAAVLDPAWTFGFDTLSELGDRGREGRYLFYIACVLGGFFFISFSYRIYHNTQELMEKTSMALFFIASILLIGVGVVPIYTRNYHLFFAYGFFSLMLLGMIIFSLHCFRQEGPGKIAGTSILILAAMDIVLLLTHTIAFAETISIITLLTWTVIYAITILKDPTVPPTNTPP